MKYYRFMSWREFNAMARYEEINGSNTCSKCHTSSEGVCFFPENIAFVDWTDLDERIVDTYGILDVRDFMSGIVSCDVLVEFETDYRLRISTGYYASLYNDEWDALQRVREACTPSYDREWMRPTRYAINPFNYENTVTWWEFRG